jgi:uncharacterized phiE125 gp8 family phage protein
LNYWTQLQRVTAPVLQPVNLAEAKSQLRVEHSDDDALISRLVDVATDMLDGPEGLGIALMPQTWKLVLPGFPRCLQLPLQPVTAITAIEYVDPAGATQVFPSGNYRLFTAAVDAEIELVTGAAWPATDQRRAAVTVTFDCGYANAAAIPASLRHAILMLVSAFYETRESETVAMGSVSATVMTAFNRLKAQYSRIALG